MGYDTPTEYTHEITQYEPEDGDSSVPTYKKVLCGDNLLGNIFYPLWRDVGCDCCSYFRGVVTGVILMTVVYGIINMVF